MYKGSYKSGSYGKGYKKPRQDATLAQQNRDRQAIIMSRRPGYAPLSNRGFGSMTAPANRERKFFDTAQANYGFNTTGTVSPIFIPVLGSDYNNRIGRKCVIKSLYIRGRAAIENAVNLGVTATPAQQGRIIVIYDKQPNGVIATIAEILNTADASSQLNPNYRDRFKIIKDKTFVFDPLVITNTVDQTYSLMNRTIYDVKIYKKLNLETIFQANAGTIGDINSGALLMVFIGTNAAGVNTDGVFTGTFRVRFDDQ